MGRILSLRGFRACYLFCGPFSWRSYWIVAQRGRNLRFLPLWKPLLPVYATRPESFESQFPLVRKNSLLAVS